MDSARPPTIRRGARRMSDVPPDVLAELSRGTAQSANLMEWLATDMGALASVVAATVPCAKLTRSLRECSEAMLGLSITQRLQLAGRAVAQAIPALSGPEFEFLARHESDLVRQWACYAVNAAEAPLPLSARLSASLRFAADANMTVREAAWMSFRPHLARSLAEGLILLEPLSRDADARVRRFAIEVTRPRSVWGSHVVPLKKEPQRAQALLENTRADPARYVQLAVGNWLNDASKTRPDWVLALASRWSREGNRSTDFIVRRGMRSIVRSQQETLGTPLLTLSAAHGEERQC
jgi:3-methyladenine DNA glycosylase AlkC